MLDDLDHISFAEWLIRLDKIARDQGFKGEPITKITGQLCWFSFYEAGVAPHEALADAVRDGQQFGAAYVDI